MAKKTLMEANPVLRARLAKIGNDQVTASDPKVRAGATAKLIGVIAEGVAQCGEDSRRARRRRVPEQAIVTTSFVAAVPVELATAKSGSDWGFGTIGAFEALAQTGLNVAAGAAAVAVVLGVPEALARIQEALAKRDRGAL